ncbi:MAG: hypothetical protein LBQ47_06215 [Endomicrobium sp.]|nr:hypothetical protein [Endomicrobium sp.]
MSKYEQLWKHLQTNGSFTIKLSFEEIKNIVGFGIDHSFLTYKKEAIQFGYNVGKISMKEKHITFNKINRTHLRFREKSRKNY